MILIKHPARRGQDRLGWWLLLLILVRRLIILHLVLGNDSVLKGALGRLHSDSTTIAQLGSTGLQHMLDHLSRCLILLSLELFIPDLLSQH